jgi:hypothetical protein
MFHEVFLICSGVVIVHTEFDHVSLDPQVAQIAPTPGLIPIVIITILFISVCRSTVDAADSSPTGGYDLVLVKLAITLLVLVWIDIVALFTGG